MKKDILRILNKVGSSEESAYYFGLYQTEGSKPFAVIKISGGCIEGSLEKIAEDLSDLYKLDITPIIIHGWGNILNKKLEVLGIGSKFVDGERYTDSRIMGKVLGVAEETGKTLLEAIVSKGAKATAVDYNSGVIIAEDNMEAGYGEHNGNVKRIDVSPIFNAIERGFIPIISPIGLSSDRKKLYNINAATAGAELVKEIDPVKYIMLTSTEGVLDNACNGNGKTISEIVLRRDFERLVKSGILHGGMLKNVEEAMYSLNVRQNGEDRSVQIVSPGNLLYELFTHRGKGTYVRKGYEVESKPISEADQQKIKAVVESRLGELNENFFNYPRIVYQEKAVKGLGVVIPNAVGIIPCLDVFAVDKRFERNGLGTDIMTAILESQNVPKPKLFWRSKPSREEANNFYFQIAEGHEKFVANDGIRYNGFWIGLTNSERIDALKYMQQKPSNFK